MTWFKKDTESLKDQIEKLKERVYKLEDPFEFEIGETVYYIQDITKCDGQKVKVKILDRYWRTFKRPFSKEKYHVKHYDILLNGKLLREITSSYLTK